MKKIYIVIILILSPIYANNKCAELFYKYQISPEIKSVYGWKRVIKKNELYKYINIPIQQEEDAQCLNKCLILYGFDIHKHTRAIGVEQ